MAAAVTPPTVAVVGLGRMGEPIAERIAAGGFGLQVWNRSAGPAERFAAAGAAVLGTPREALTQADVCVSMVSDDDALRAVLLGPDGVVAGARPGTVLVDMSTVSVDASAQVGAAADAAGIGYVRAPVSGNPVVVRAGNLLIVVSGPADAIERVTPVLDVIGRRTIAVGAGEQARVVKLALQVLIGGTAELVAEAIALGEASDVDRAALLEVISASAVGSPFVAYKAGPLVRNDFSATFTTTMMMKDVDLVLSLAAREGLTLPFTEQLRPLLEQTAAAGHADEDFMALLLQRLPAESTGSAR